MFDQDTYKTVLTNFTISKWLCEMDKLMFFNALIQGQTNIAVWIVSIDNLCKKLSSAYNLNINSLKVYI